MRGKISRLFPIELAAQQWLQFSAAGFQSNVSGALFRADQPPCCGVALGGLGTGCLDIDARGIYGWSSLFNPIGPRPLSPSGRIPRKLPRVQAILGLSVGGATWVLATPQALGMGPGAGGTEMEWCTEPGGNDAVGKLQPFRLPCPRIEGVQPATQIHYWGHYPVADLEYETSAPLSVGMRAWAPFLPGDAAASNIPAALFEVHVRNESGTTQRATLALNFPGPDAQEANGTEFTRQSILEDFQGVLVSSPGGVNYTLGVMGTVTARFGTGLHEDARAWSKIASELPGGWFREEGGVRRYRQSSCSAAVDLSLKSGEQRGIRFLLAWYAPVREAQTRNWPGKSDGTEGPLRFQWKGSPHDGPTHFYTHMYASRYSSSREVARRVAAEHQQLLARVLGWQQVIYEEPSLPIWLRDALINNLYLLAENSHWAQPKPPLGDWVYPEGAFALDESPRGCPHMSCIPCDWYGNLPVVFFFPELARSTLRQFKHFQLENGEIPFSLGTIDLPDFAVPDYFWQVSLNGFCFIDMVDRLWQATGDRSVLQEFYDSARRGNTYVMGLSKDPGRAIRMPEIGGMEWFEWGEWAGWTSHAGGLRLAGLLMLERMALEMGDGEYARQCRTWFDEGSKVMEEQMWADSYYLNYYEPETGKRSDVVMGYQLDGEWAARYHGLSGVFRRDRIPAVLDTIRRCNMALTPEIGAANFAEPQSRALDPSSKVAFYGTHAMFTPEVLLLAYTYIQEGQKELGMELARKYWANLVLRQRHGWDTPNIVQGDTCKRFFGSDYGQNMMLWAFPGVIEGQDIRAAAGEGSLARKVLAAAAG